MTNEYFEEALIKEVPGNHQDRVFRVKNLPKSLLFQFDKSGLPTLLDGIEESQTGDHGFVFVQWEQKSMARLKDIDRYIEKSFPRDQRIPTRVKNAQQPDDPRSGPLGLSQMPLVDLPLPGEERKSEVVEEKPRKLPPLFNAPKPVLEKCDECGKEVNSGQAMRMHKTMKHRKEKAAV